MRRDRHDVEPAGSGERGGKRIGQEHRTREPDAGPRALERAQRERVVRRVDAGERDTGQRQHGQRGPAPEDAIWGASACSTAASGTSAAIAATASVSRTHVHATCATQSASSGANVVAA